jgi:uncharacterized protein YndB with AHSA1/START domain
MNRADEQDTTDEVVVECELAAPPAKVWRAITVPELVSAWIDPRPGEKADEGQSYEMLDALPYSQVRYAWRDGEAGCESTVIFEISPQPDGHTWFRLTHRTAKPVRAANGNSPPVALAA